MLALLHLLSLVALVARGVVVLQQFVRALFAPVLAQRWVDDVAVQICSCLSCPSFGKIVPQYDPAVRYSGADAGACAGVHPVLLPPRLRETVQDALRRGPQMEPHTQTLHVLPGTLGCWNIELLVVDDHIDIFLEVRARLVCKCTGPSASFIFVSFCALWFQPWCPSSNIQAATLERLQQCSAMRFGSTSTLLYVAPAYLTLVLGLLDQALTDCVHLVHHALRELCLAPTGFCPIPLIRLALQQLPEVCDVWGRNAFLLAPALEDSVDVQRILAKALLLLDEIQLCWRQMRRHGVGMM